RAAVEKCLADRASSAAPILDVDLRSSPSIVFDWSAGSTSLGADPATLNPATAADRIYADLKAAHASVGIGRYNEGRLFYPSPMFGPASGAESNPIDERRTIHLGIDLFVAAGSADYAPLEGTIHALANNAAQLDYGPVVILRHVVDSLNNKK